MRFETLERRDAPGGLGFLFDLLPAQPAEAGFEANAVAADDIARRRVGRGESLATPNGPREFWRLPRAGRESIRQFAGVAYAGLDIEPSSSKPARCDRLQQVHNAIFGGDADSAFAAALRARDGAPRDNASSPDAASPNGARSTPAASELFWRGGQHDRRGGRHHGRKDRPDRGDDNHGDFTPPAALEDQTVYVSGSGWLWENASSPTAVGIYRTGNISQALTVNIATSGTATEGSDYQNVADTFTIPAYVSSAPLFLYAINDANYEGNETIVITVQAGAGYNVGTPGTATVTLLDDDPRALDDKGYTARGVPVTMSVLVNDTDPNFNSLSVTAVTQPADGTATFTSLGVTYTPDDDTWFGVDSFEYQMTDGQGGYDWGLVTVYVIALELDVNADTDITDSVDGAANYLPGEEGGVPVLSTGDSYNEAQYLGQRMNLVVQPAGLDIGLQSVAFSITSVTAYHGYSENTSDPKIEGSGKTADFSFRELVDHNSMTVTPSTTPSQGGEMLADRTRAEFWAKDYGGAAAISATLTIPNVPPLVLALRVPFDADSDGLADLWEATSIADWNAQFGASETISTAFFDTDDDKELKDPDGSTNVLTFSNDGGVNMGDHATAGDGRMAIDEYRGFVLDGGGHDWNGANAHGGGHVRLNPAYKELLVEVDAMENVANMPSRSGIAGWMDAVAEGASQKVDGTGTRLFYILQDLATPHDLFMETPAETPQQLARAYADSYIDGSLPSFTHLHLIDQLGAENTAGVGWLHSMALFGVDFGKDFADAFGVAFDVCAPAYISHELHHTLSVEAHLDDTNDNGTKADPDDQTRVLFDYNYTFPAKALGAYISSTDATIPLDNTTNLASKGVVVIEMEWISYTGISGNSLTGATRGAFGTAAAAHGSSSAVTPRYAALDLTQIKYGIASVEHVEVK